MRKLTLKALAEDTGITGLRQRDYSDSNTKAPDDIAYTNLAGKKVTIKAKPARFAKTKYFIDNSWPMCYIEFYNFVHSDIIILASNHRDLIIKDNDALISIKYKAGNSIGKCAFNVPREYNGKITQYYKDIYDCLDNAIPKQPKKNILDLL